MMANGSAVRVQIKGCTDTDTSKCIINYNHVCLYILLEFQHTVGKRNYFTGYGILLHELPVVSVLSTQGNNNEWTMKNSIILNVLWNYFHEVIPLTCSEQIANNQE